MANQLNQVLIFWLDKNGRQCTTFWTTQNQTSGGAGAYTALAAASQNVSAAAVVGFQFQQTVYLTATATTGPYQSVLDKAYLLTKLEGLSGTVRYAIPAPLDTIFLPGNEIVDLSNPNVSALLTEMQAVLSDGVGHNVSSFKRGWRARSGSR